MNIETITDHSSIEEHPLLDVIPEPSTEDYETLHDDIKTNGVIDPLALDADGRLIDGRTRLRICRELGLPVPVVRYPLRSDDEILSFMISRNVSRRNVTKGQCAACAVDLATRSRGGNQSAELPNARSQEQAAKRWGVSVRLVGMAAKVKKTSPELLADVKSGKLSLEQAYRQAMSNRPPRTASATTNVTANTTTVAKTVGVKASAQPAKTQEVAEQHAPGKSKAKRKEESYPGIYGNLYTDLAGLKAALVQHPLSKRHAIELHGLLQTALAAMAEFLETPSKGEPAS